MAYTIAVAGKGGVGKTTLAGLLVRFLKERGHTPILAVDADSNSNLNEVLGLEVEHTLGEAREEMKSVGAQNPNMTKDMLIEMRVNQALVEAEGFDLIAMGRPEGPGCYCAANHLLTASMDQLAANYNYLVVDNEAGMEHISRITTQKIDELLLVSDASRRSLTAAKRIADLAQEMKVLKGQTHLLLNMVRNGQGEAMAQAASEMGLNLAGLLPDDPELAEYDLAGRPTSTLPQGSLVVQAAFKAFESLLPS